MATIINLPRGRFSFWKPRTIELDDEGNLTITESFKSFASEAFSLCPQIKSFHKEYGKARCSGISIVDDESGQLSFTTIKYSQRKGDTGDPLDFDGKEIEISSSVSEEPIFIHPKYKGQVDNLDDDDLASLKAFAGGQLTDEKGTELKSKLKGKIPAELMRKILRGQTSFYSVRVEAKMTFPSKITIPPTGKMCTFNGLPGLPQGHTWLSMGGGNTRRNGRTVTQASFLGGMWDEDIYKQ